MEETPLQKRQRLDREISQQVKDLDRKRAERDRIVQRCNHNWGETTPAHIHHAGYTISGDEPGTMGVDWRGPCNVSPSTEKRWKRVCSKCGEVEHTSRTNKSTVETPRF